MFNEWIKYNLYLIRWRMGAHGAILVVVTIESVEQRGVRTHSGQLEFMSKVCSACMRRD